MKKGISLLVFVAALSSAAYAADFPLSAGGGGLFRLGFGGGVGSDSSSTAIGGGVFGFFDANYVEADVAFTFAADTAKDADVSTTVMSLELGLLGKYPIPMGQLILFPLLGINYQMVLSASTDGNSMDDAGKWLSALWINLGGGVDYALSDALYFRGELLYGLRLNNKAETDAADAFDLKANLGHGITVKAGVGYKF